ncbi:MAG: DNA mismatch endonuclease Vsr [Acidobacteriota bacterium]
MPDVFDRQKRSEIMRKIGPKDSAPEMRVRSIVHRLGYRFRLHGRDLPGTPDIVLPGHRKVIFMHSCFFHGHRDCPRATIPATRSGFWEVKIEGNARRDRASRRRLRRLAWECLVIWQCEIRKGTEERLRAKIRRFLEG